MLRKVEDGLMYLDSANITWATDVWAKAYLLDAKASFSEKAGAFLVFYFREVQGNTIVGRMFNVKDFLTLGYTLTEMKRRPVKVKFTAQNFNGSLSLIVSEISLYTEKDFDYELFLGGFPDVHRKLEELNTTIEKICGVRALPYEAATSALLEVCNGKVGGFVVMSQITLNSLLSFIDNLPTINKNDLVFCFARTLSFYFKYLSMLGKVDIPMKHEVLSLVNNYAQSGDVRLMNIVTDCLLAVAGVNKPNHLFAHIIYTHLLSAEKLLRYAHDYPLIMDGSTKRVGDDLLSRY